MGLEILIGSWTQCFFLIYMQHGAYVFVNYNSLLMFQSYLKSNKGINITIFVPTANDSFTTRRRSRLPVKKRKYINSHNFFNQKQFIKIFAVDQCINEFPTYKNIHTYTQTHIHMYTTHTHTHILSPLLRQTPSPSTIFFFTNIIYPPSFPVFNHCDTSSPLKPFQFNHYLSTFSKHTHTQTHLPTHTHKHTPRHTYPHTHTYTQTHTWSIESRFSQHQSRQHVQAPLTVSLV